MNTFMVAAHAQYGCEGVGQDMLYDLQCSVFFEYRGREFTVDVSYYLEEPTGFSDDPWGAVPHIGNYYHPKTGKRISTRLQTALSNKSENRVLDAIEAEGGWG